MHWNVPGWYECSTERKPCKQVRARGGGAYACLAHALQCLRDRRACCPSLPKQLVICRFLRFHRRRHVVVTSPLFHWTGTGWIEFPTEWKPCKRVRARGGGAWGCLAHALQCLYDGRACCPVLPKQLVICRSCGVQRRPSRWCFNLLFQWDWYGLV